MPPEALAVADPSQIPAQLALLMLLKITVKADGWVIVTDTCLVQLSADVIITKYVPAEILSINASVSPGIGTPKEFSH